MRCDRRQETLRNWRSRHGVTAANQNMAGARSPSGRRPHRAPTPRVVPTGGWTGRRARRVGGVLLGLAGVALLSTGVCRATALRVTHGSVRGNQRLSARAIYDAAGIDGKHMLAVNWGRTADRVGQLAGVREARVTPDLPGGVSIAVVETTLVLAWTGRDGSVAIDETGARDPNGGVAGLPMVSSADPMPLDARGRLRPDVLAAAVAYARRLGNLTYDGVLGFTGRTGDGWTVRMGSDPALMTGQMAALDALLAQLPRDGSGSGLIDLRFPQRPYYRLSEGTP